MQTGFLWTSPEQTGSVPGRSCAWEKFAQPENNLCSCNGTGCSQFPEVSSDCMLMSKLPRSSLSPFRKSRTTHHFGNNSSMSSILCSICWIPLILQRQTPSVRVGYCSHGLKLGTMLWPLAWQRYFEVYLTHLLPPLLLPWATESLPSFPLFAHRSNHNILYLPNHSPSRPTVRHTHTRRPWDQDNWDPTMENWLTMDLLQLIVRQIPGYER